MPLLQRFRKYMKDNPEKFKEIKSSKFFTQTFGGIAGAYIWMVEFDNLADYEKWLTRMRKDEVYMKIYQESMLLIDPATYSLSIWNTIE